VDALLDPVLLKVQEVTNKTAVVATTARMLVFLKSFMLGYFLDILFVNIKLI
jgi:hypothetical protein